MITLTFVYEYSLMEILYIFICRETSTVIVHNMDQSKGIPNVQIVVC